MKGNMGQELNPTSEQIKEYVEKREACLTEDVKGIITRISLEAAKYLLLAKINAKQEIQWAKEGTIWGVIRPCTGEYPTENKKKELGEKLRDLWLSQIKLLLDEELSEKSAIDENDIKVGTWSEVFECHVCGEPYLTKAGAITCGCWAIPLDKV